MAFFDRARPLLLLLAGMIGAAGVALAAASTHLGAESFLSPASAMCLAHAPAILALYLANDKVRTASLAALAMALGTVLFAGDLVSRQFLGASLFPMAAPSGGMLMIGGWIIVALGAFLPVRA